VVSGEPLDPDQPESDEPPASPEGGGPSERRNGPREIAEVSFPVSLRGYDRDAVDAYVSRVKQLVAELELTRSPEAAVKNALEQVGEQTKGVLAQAGETVEQITIAARQDAEASTARAKHEAEDRVASAKAEAAEILAHSKGEAEASVAQAREKAAKHLQRAREEVAALREEAQGRMRELHADTEAVRQERSQLLDDIHEIAARVDEVASAADTRFPRPQTSEPAGEEHRQPGAAGGGNETEDTATDKPTAQAGARGHSPR
jgi:DivIVA domain-containing protein